MSKTKIYGPVRFFLLLVAILLAVTAFVHISTVNAGSTLVTTSDNSGTGSLREAITNASAGDVITFDASLAGVTITLSSELPDVDQTTTIDAANLKTAPIISGPGTGEGFFCSGAGTTLTIKGLNITGFATGIKNGNDCAAMLIGDSGTAREAVYIDDVTYGIHTLGATTIVNTYIGTSNNAATHGIFSEAASGDITIGSTAALGNVTVQDTGSTTAHHGISITSGANVYIYNTTVDNSTGSGLSLSGATSTVGGDSTNEKNIFTGNGVHGVSIESAAVATLEGNYIGLAADGSTVDANTSHGVNISSTGAVTVGGAAEANGNLISGHSGSGDRGIFVDNTAGTTIVKFNKIGVDSYGANAKANEVGIEMEASGFTIQFNQISGNSGDGIIIDDADAAITAGTINGNNIGLNKNQDAAIANGDDGIEVLNANGSNAVSNLIIQNNKISGNTDNGLIVNADTLTFDIWGNKVGTNETALIDLGNGADGMHLLGNTHDLDASADSTKRNIIIGNTGECIEITGDSNLVKNNYCGVGTDGTTEVANGSGIRLSSGSDSNTIGGITAAHENLICATTATQNFVVVTSGDYNAIRGNDVVCDLTDPMLDLIGSANESTTKPTISSASSSAVSGNSAVASQAVDLYGKNASAGGYYVSTVDADGSGNFSFTSQALTTACGGASCTTVIAVSNTSGGSSSEASNGVSVTHTNPTAASVTGVQQTAGEGDVLGTAVLDDANDDDTLSFKVEYSLDGGSSWLDATLSTTDSETSATYGDPAIDNDATYQVGTTAAPVTSSSGANTVTFRWEAASDVPSTTDITNAQFRVTPYDGNDAGTAATSSNFVLDVVDPTLPGNFDVLGSVTTGVATWTASVETNFNHYEIWIGGVEASVLARTTTEWDDDNDSDLTTRTTTTTTITGGTSYTSYFAIICSVDDYGNEGCSTTADTFNTSTVATPTVTSTTGHTVSNSFYTVTGTKPVNSGLWNNGVQVVAVDSSSTYSYATGLSQGANNFSLTTKNEVGTESSATAFTVTLDSLAPATPTCTFPSTTTSTRVTVTCTGTAANANVFVGGVDTNIDADGTGTATTTFNVSAGLNTYSLTMVDNSGNASAAVSIAISYTVGLGGGGSAGRSGAAITNTSRLVTITTAVQEFSIAGEAEQVRTVAGTNTRSSTQGESEDLAEVEGIKEDSKEDLAEVEDTKEVKPENLSSEQLEQDQPPSTARAPRVNTPRPSLIQIIFGDSKLEETGFIPEIEFETQSLVAIISEFFEDKEVENKPNLLDQFSIRRTPPKLKSPTYATLENIGAYGNRNSFGIPEQLIALNFLGEDPGSDSDADADGVSDYQEIITGSNPYRGDTDGDGLDDAEEIASGSDPANWDSDGDGVSDSRDADSLLFQPTTSSRESLETYTVENGISEPLGRVDSDGDGISDEQEFRIGTDPQRRDSDGDGLDDGDEYLGYGTNPNSPTTSQELGDLRITNLVNEEVLATGKQLIQGRGEPGSIIELVRITETGHEKVIGQSEVNEEGFFVVLTEELKAGTYTILANSIGGQYSVLEDISQVLTLTVREDTSVPSPVHNERILSNNATVTKPKLSLSSFGNNFDGELYLIVIWESKILHQTIIADKDDQDIEIFPNETLEPGAHKVTWYAIDLATQLKSPATQLSFFVIDEENLEMLTSKENLSFYTALGLTLLLISFWQIYHKPSKSSLLLSSSKKSGTKK